MARKLKDTDFLYISTRLRCLEGKMLSKDRMERMIEARTDEDAAKVLAECGYTGLEQLTPDTLSRSLSAVREVTFGELAAVSGSEKIVDTFRIKYDYHNLKALLKCIQSGKGAEDMLIEAGRYPISVLRDAVQKSGGNKLSTAMRAAMTEAQNVLAATGDPQKSDFLLDQACYGEMLETAMASRSKFLLDYVKLQIDAVNLKSAVRAIRMKKGADFLKGVLLPGGTVETAKIANTCITGGNLEAVFCGRLHDAATLGDACARGGRQTEFEKACDNALNAYLQEARMVPFGDSVLVSYVAAKENEITAARIIMTGRMAGVTTESIRERLRDAYV